MAADKAEFWTTEQVAEHLGITKQDVYESARRNEFPGNVGVHRGRRKLYRSDLIEAGPQEPETTNEPLVALLWTAQGIEAKLAEILRELKAQGEANRVRTTTTQDAIATLRLAMPSAREMRLMMADDTEEE